MENLKKDKIETSLLLFTNTIKDESKVLTEKYSSYEYFKDASNLIIKTLKEGKRIHVSGIGKMHHCASYCASLLSSLGILTYLLDGTEATHGSSGQVAKGDLVICLSYWGSVSELNNSIVTLRQNGAKILSLTGFDTSWIAQNSDVHLNVFVEKEGDELGKPPRASVLSVLYCIQCLSIVLQAYYGLTMSQYLKWHPSGIIGSNIK